MAAPQSWLKLTPAGLYCEPGGFFVDPAEPVDHAVITHGHGDHARPGHRHVLATPETAAIMQARYGEAAAVGMQPLRYGQALQIGPVSLRFVPAGHILGSAQVVLEHAGGRAVVSGDYKRRRDPTCPPFELVPCDLFISEATFGLPVFAHPPAEDEIAKLLEAQRLFPESAQLVGVYALGKAQRVIMLLRAAGYDAPIYLHGALQTLCDLYRAHGVALGDLRPATGAAKDTLVGQIVLAPPSVFGDRWTRRLPEPIPAMASGWMRVRARARQRGVELPLVISDHADWPELTQTLAEVQAQEIWLTHGQEDALLYHCQQQGISARALSLAGRGEEAEEAA
jgi:putative mRNA 3-end processing factor